MKSHDTRGMKWFVGDALNPECYPIETYDYVLDKGTLDAFIIGEIDKWEIDQKIYDISAQYFQNIIRTLKPGGTFVQISFGPPHFRRRLFASSSN